MNRRTQEQPDADLLALCDRYIASERDFRRLIDAELEAEARHGVRSPEAKAAEAASAAHIYDVELLAAI